MAYTVEPSDAQTIDLSEAKKDLTHFVNKYREKFTTGAGIIEKVIVFDPRKAKNLQIKSNGTDLWGIETTTNPGFENTDILHPTKVPWILLKDIATNKADFQSGGIGVNEGILAARITTVALTGDFEINADQHVQEVKVR